MKMKMKILLVLFTLIAEARQIIKVQKVDMNCETLQYWNSIQQRQIDYLLTQNNKTKILINNLNNRNKKFVDSVAGNLALQGIDFGEVKENQIKAGIGVGFSLDSSALGFGIKTKYKEINYVLKAWTTEENSGIGLGMTFDLN